MQKVFNMFDEQGKGTISLKDLKRVAKELGENMSGTALFVCVCVCVSLFLHPLVAEEGVARLAYVCANLNEIFHTISLTPTDTHINTHTHRGRA